MLLCPKCQSQNSDHSRFCIKCGEIFNVSTPEAPKTLSQQQISGIGRKKKIILATITIALLFLTTIFFIKNKEKFQPHVVNIPITRETVNAYGQKPVAGEDFEKGTIIFGLKTGKLTADGKPVQTEAEIKILDKTNPSSLLDIFTNYQATSLMRPFADNEVLGNVYLLKMSENTDILALMTDLQKDPNIQFAEPNYYAQATDYTPNDPYFSSKGSWGQDYDDLWNLKQIGMPKAWEITKGDPSVTVAVIDTGVDHLSPDLEGNVIEGWSGPLGPLKHGFTGDCDAHGTHVAGIIAARDDDFGIIGVAPKVKIMPLTLHPCPKIPPDKLYPFKIPTESGESPNPALIFVLDLLSRVWSEFTALDVANLAFHALGDNAKIINFSQEISFGSHVMNATVSKLVSSDNVVFVAAAGNSGARITDQAPANNSDAIVVSAVGNDDNFTGYSNFGSAITVAAPGGGPISMNLLSTGSTQMDLNTLVFLGVSYKVDDNHILMAGTSMAAPHVAGLAALVKSLHPAWNNKKIRCAIIQGADDKGDPGWDEKYGFGRINAYKTLLLEDVSEDCLPIAEISDPVINAGVDLADPIAIKGTASASELENYKVEYLAEGADPQNGWQTIAQSSQRVIKGDLGMWNASNLKEGNYQIRLTVFAKISLPIFNAFGLTPNFSKTGDKAVREISVYLYKPQKETQDEAQKITCGEAGNECSSDSDCQSGLICNSVTKRCGEGLSGNFCLTDSGCQNDLECVNYLCNDGGVGAQCDIVSILQGKPLDTCDPGLFCSVNGVCGYKGSADIKNQEDNYCGLDDEFGPCREGTVCALKVTDPLLKTKGSCSEGKQGYWCAEDGDCQQDLKCIGNPKVTYQNRIFGVCSKGGINDFCQNDSCQPGLRCEVLPISDTALRGGRRTDIGICVKDCVK